MIQYQNMTFDYEPYPIGLATPAFAPETYRALVESWPPLELFEYKADKGDKYSLSQVNNAWKYRRYVKSSAPWRELHRFVRSRAFIDGAIEMVKKHGIDLGLPIPGFFERLYLKARALKRGGAGRRGPVSANQRIRITVTMHATACATRATANHASTISAGSSSSQKRIRGRES